MRLYQFIGGLSLVRQQWQVQWQRRRRRWKHPISIPGLDGLSSFQGSGLIILLVLFSFLPSVMPLRCYTDVMATKARSVECGLNTGCVKIYIDSEEMLLRRQQNNYAYSSGETIPGLTLPERYQDNPILLRGCFVLAVPDRCYTAVNGLTYCWCSTKDLCNAATPTLAIRRDASPIILLSLAVLAVIQFSYLKSFLSVHHRQQQSA